MSIAVVFKIAGIGILVAIICQLLKQTGRDDMAMLAALSGLLPSAAERFQCARTAPRACVSHDAICFSDRV